MQLDHIRTFLEVAASGSFSTAARRLHVTQSTVSMRVQALEDELDRKLFVRGRAGARLTAAGARFQRYAIPLVQAWQQAQLEVALPEGYSASLGIGVQMSLWKRLMPGWVPWMQERSPGVALRLEANYSDMLMDMLISGMLHLGVMYGPRAVPDFSIETLLEERLVMVSSRQRKLSSGWPEDYVYIDWGTLFRAWHSEAFPGTGAPSLSYSLWDPALARVLDRGGTGYFPLWVVEELLEEERLSSVPDAPAFVRPAYAVYPERSSEDDLVQLGLDGLRHVAATFRGETNRSP